jgi:hypothetical protein
MENIVRARHQPAIASHNDGVACSDDVKRKKTSGCFIRHQALPYPI